jgi:hypothetical protein
MMMIPSSIPKPNMKALLCAIFIASTVFAGAAQKRPRDGSYCTPDGGKGAVRCGNVSYMACIEIHPDICSLEDPMPSCCASSSESPDRTAQYCQCCAKKKASVKITIPYDSL